MTFLSLLSHDVLVVLQDVLVDGHQGGEGLLTVGAFAAPYGTVGVLLFGVGSEIGWLGETVATEGALERLLTSVDHHVMEQGLSGDQTGR